MKYLKVNNEFVKYNNKLIRVEVPTLPGIYECNWDWVKIHGTPRYSTMAIPYANCTAITTSPKVDLISTTAYRNGTQQTATVNNCLDIISASDIKFDYNVRIGTDNVYELFNFTAYLGLCTASDLSDWKNTSTILDQISYSDTNAYWRTWSGTCTANNVKGILFYATESDKTTQLPRLFGDFNNTNYIEVK